ncbi:hypothetical protein BC939DRAFT_55666 [Gamsiella multidivaricata]|uniref:uncharacterized protein n=1 Tax=Gamsiella multidivaricata TaxID=101098 RepID=UPI002220B0BD|nr:uncharacterized protein BC939DRAFT_55666 [Gamsiella multidivaricata]KAI7816223.1 hypothetical protein BC939DRAFT_55666 [Gamsiella multidivaricata]
MADSSSSKSKGKLVENASITAPDVDPEHDPATAILRKKSAPNKLIVDDATNDDNSVLALSTATMEKLQFFRGDMVLVKGKKRRDTVLIVLADDSVEDSKLSATTFASVSEMLSHFTPAPTLSTASASTSCPSTTPLRVSLEIYSKST